MRYLVNIVLFLTLSACAVQGLFVPRNPLSSYQGNAVAPEVVPVADGYAIKAVLHTHTDLSHAALTPQQLIDVARSRSVKVLGITEHDNLEVCWSRLFCFRDPSVQRMGYAAYLKQMAELQRQNADVVLLPGLEVSPYAWWSGFPPFLTLHDWDLHFTMYNLEDPNVLQDMPIPGDRYPRCCSYRTADGSGRYEDFVRYVTAAGGVVFQAHPHSEPKREFYGVSAKTQARPEYVAALPGLNGFAALPTGRTTLLGPDGIWDAALLEYLDGKRERALWVVGDSDFHGADQRLDAVVTWIYASAAEKDSVLRSMATGRMVAVKGGAGAAVRVQEFSLCSPHAGKPQVMCGETVHDPAAGELRFALTGPVSGLTVRLIRNGKVIFTTGKEAFVLDERPFLSTQSKAYYRVEATGDEGFTLVTNPLFWRR